MFWFPCDRNSKICGLLLQFSVNLLKLHVTDCVSHMSFCNLRMKMWRFFLLRSDELSLLFVFSLFLLTDVVTELHPKWRLNSFSYFCRQMNTWSNTLLAPWEENNDKQIPTWAPAWFQWVHVNATNTEAFNNLLKLISATFRSSFTLCKIKCLWVAHCHTNQNINHSN